MSIMGVMGLGMSRIVVEQVFSGQDSTTNNFCSSVDDYYVLDMGFIGVYVIGRISFKAPLQTFTYRQLKRIYCLNHDPGGFFYVPDTDSCYKIKSSHPACSANQTSYVSRSIYWHSFRIIIHFKRLTQSAIVDIYSTMRLATIYAHHSL